MTNFKRFGSFILESSEGFSKTYDMPEGWWKDWKEENEAGYEIEKNEFYDTYRIKDGDELIFKYDPKEEKVYTNKEFNFFMK